MDSQQTDLLDIHELLSGQPFKANPKQSRYYWTLAFLSEVAIQAISIFRVKDDWRIKVDVSRVKLLPVMMWHKLRIHGGESVCIIIITFFTVEDVQTL